MAVRLGNGRRGSGKAERSVVMLQRIGSLGVLGDGGHSVCRAAPPAFGARNSAPEIAPKLWQEVKKQRPEPAAPHAVEHQPAHAKGKLLLHCGG